MVPGSHPAEALDRLHEQTGGMCGVNFLMPFVDRAAVEAAASRTKFVEFFYGIPIPPWSIWSIEGAHSPAGRSGHRRRRWQPWRRGAT